MKINGLYVITDETIRPGRTHEDVTTAAVAGGAKIIQLRDKTADDRRIYEAALAIRTITRRAGVVFIVNNSVDVALAADADGVHVGQSDLPAAEVRKLIGPTKLLGVSVATVEEARQAVRDGADHLGVGPVFSTSTKSDAGDVVGLEHLSLIRKVSGLPIVAIGGIGQSNIASVATAGADSAAVISAVVAEDDMEAATRELAGAFIPLLSKTGR